MNNNIKYYDKNHKEYTQSSIILNMEDTINKFINLGSLKPGDSILDAGCGSGRDSLVFSIKGFNVTAFDGSLPMVASLKEKSPEIHSYHSLFSDFKETINEYNGIWACASLLHISTAEFFETMRKLSLSLKSGGVFYFSIKKAIGDGINEWKIGDRTFYHPGKHFIYSLTGTLDLDLVCFYETGKIGDPSQTFENYFFIKK